MIIREATLEDLIGIADVAAVLGYEALDRNALEQSLSALLKSTQDKVWVAETVLDSGNHSTSSAQITGWLHAFYAVRLASPAFVEIGGLAVSADQQRNGMGRALVETAKAWSASMNCKLRVRCNEKRHQAHQFYQALGFETSKNQKVFQYQAKH